MMWGDVGFDFIQHLVLLPVLSVRVLSWRALQAGQRLEGLVWQGCRIQAER